MKTFIAKYMLYVYRNFIEEDWDEYRKWIVPFLKPAWFVRSVIFWTLSVVLFPIFYVGMLFDDVDIEELIKKQEKFYNKN
jgi:hypothetical protein